MSLREGDLPIVAVAIHDGHGLRPEVEERMALADSSRLREEDPFTGSWTQIVPMNIVAHYSRFEVDLNRPRDKAVYQEPEDAWGLEVWKTPLSSEMVERSLENYDAFYDEVRVGLQSLVDRLGRLVVLDLHTYNHRRDGVDATPSNPALSPEVNIGTGSMNRDLWGPIVDGFMKDLHSFDFLGRNLDVRENVKFRGGRFSTWVHETFPETVCCPAIEFKKFFMDEWSGTPDEEQLRAIPEALRGTIPGITKGLRCLA